MTHTVTPAEAGRSLRDLLRHVLFLSDGAIRRAKWEERILRNGEPGRLRDPCRAGDVITCLPARQQPAWLPKPFDLPLDIPWRNERLLIVDKPAPLASQSGRGHPDDSLENAVFSLLGCPGDFIYRPVNRLDRGTSGLMAVALDAEEQARLQALLHTERFRRRYLAVTEGIPPRESGIVDAPIAKAEGATVRRVISPAGKPSVTHYQVLAVCEEKKRALVRLTLETGRTHQIRVHLASLGCPVFGDFLYGREDPALPGRFALHSAELAFPTPEGAEVSLTSPLPSALQALLEPGDAPLPLG